MGSRTATTILVLPGPRRSSRGSPDEPVGIIGIIGSAGRPPGCPGSAPTESWDTRPGHVHVDDCQSCFLCVFDCPLQAISLSQPESTDVIGWG